VTDRTLVLCDGAKRTAGDSFESVISISHREHEAATTNIAIRMPRQGLRFDDRSMDLVRIAAYAFAADQQVTRGGEKDLYGDKWVRDFTMRVPVHDPAFWSTESVRLSLEAALYFASEDRWRFEFTAARPETDFATMLNVESSEQLGRPDAVVLFSGGADSLCAAVEQHVKNGRRPLLLRHSPAANLKGRQTRLRDALRQKFATWHWPIVDCAVHRVGSEPRETTNRTRSFLYASFGLAIARALRLSEIHLCDNGVVSLNLPINDQLVGSRASRSTHPRFLDLYNRFAATALGKPIKVVNSLWSRTRTEALAALTEAGCGDLMSLTNSCARHRGRLKAQPHCGTCSQCLDRRFAVIGAGLDDQDYGEQYEVDVFRASIPEGDDRTMAVSYVGFASEVSELSPESMFERFPQLYDCVPNDGTQQETVTALTAMLGRHGQQVVGVMSEQIAAASEDLARQKLPDTCLVKLVARGEAGPRLPAVELEEAAGLALSVRNGTRSSARGGRPRGAGVGAMVACWIDCHGAFDRFDSKHAFYDTAHTLLQTRELLGTPPMTREALPRRVADARRARMAGSCPYPRHKEGLPPEISPD